MTPRFFSLMHDRILRTDAETTREVATFTDRAVAESVIGLLNQHLPKEGQRRYSGLATDQPAWQPGMCLAARWAGYPIYLGDHEPHLFHYGPNDLYTGHCGGTPPPLTRGYWEWVLVQP